MSFNSFKNIINIIYNSNKNHFFKNIDQDLCENTRYIYEKELVNS